MQPIIDQLRKAGISVKYDDADNKRPGFKFADYELKGVPVRLAIGGRDLENGTIEVMRRDTLEKETLPLDGIAERVKDGGFFLCHWDGTAETEAKIKEETQATIRCVPFMFEQTPGIDMVSGKPATQRVIIARSY